MKTITNISAGYMRDKPILIFKLILLIQKMALPAVDTGYRDVPKVARAQQIKLLRTVAKKRLVP